MFLKQIITSSNRFLCCRRFGIVVVIYKWFQHPTNKMKKTNIYWIQKTSQPPHLLHPSKAKITINFQPSTSIILTPLAARQKIHLQKCKLHFLTSPLTKAVGIINPDCFNEKTRPWRPWCWHAFAALWIYYTAVTPSEHHWFCSNECWTILTSGYLGCERWVRW